MVNLCVHVSVLSIVFFQSLTTHHCNRGTSFASLSWESAAPLYPFLSGALCISRDLLTYLFTAANLFLWEFFQKHNRAFTTGISYFANEAMLFVFLISISSFFFLLFFFNFYFLIWYLLLSKKFYIFKCTDWIIPGTTLTPFRLDKCHPVGTSRAE